LIVPLNQETVLEYAHRIPGLARNDNLFAALYRNSHMRALERCDLLLSEVSSVPITGVRQVRMLRRLRTMIKLLSEQEAAAAEVSSKG
jgi:hypothetical protein